MSGRLEWAASAIAGSKYYFTAVRPDAHGVDIIKTIYALDLGSGAITAVYQPAGDASDNRITLTNTGAQILIVDRNIDDDTITLWAIDSADDSTVQLTVFSGYPLIHSLVEVEGVVYFVVAGGGYDPAYEVEETGIGGRIGERGENGNPLALRVVNTTNTARLDLWRTDGTAAGTGVVRTLWTGDASGKQVMATLTAANGKLAIRTDVSTGVRAEAVWSDEGLVTESDETIVYDPRELALGRSGATARLVNGVLRLGGSLDDDNIRLWRSARNPDRLVVEYNGNSRSFAFSDVTKIVVDLQAGNDRFEIIETDGGAVRARTSVMGGDGTDTILTGTGRDTIIGGSGGDLIRSRGNADVIVGGGGRDRINAGNGDDQIAGGTGNDQILGGAGADVLFGQTAIEIAFGRDLEAEDALEDLMLRAE